MRFHFSAVLGLTLLVSNCSQAPTRSDERFCGELTTHVASIRTLPTTVEEVPGLIQLYSRIGEVAPLAVESEWRQLIVNLKTAAQTDINDPNAARIIADTAYASEQSARGVVTWARDVCGLDLGPVGAVEQGTLATTTTTIAD
jgi:hypothetical protein